MIGHGVSILCHIGMFVASSQFVLTGYLAIGGESGEVRCVLHVDGHFQPGTHCFVCGTDEAGLARTCICTSTNVCVVFDYCFHRFGKERLFKACISLEERLRGRI